MKFGRFWALVILAGIFCIGMVWQASRFADLSAKAADLEQEQENWIAQNRKLEAEIALLSSRERTSAMADRLGLKKALPEEKLRILLSPESAQGAVSAGRPLSSAKLPGGGVHD
jgi:hypothetical protein